MGHEASLAQETERLVREAAKIALAMRPSITASPKRDGSLVTEADPKVEEFLRPRLQALVPGSSCWGEELGREEPAQAGFWVLDPIDGTSNYIFGLPSWGTSVALVRKGRVELGVVHLPVWEETFACARGSGVFRNGEIMATVPAGRVRPEELVGASGAVCKWVPPRLLPGKMRCSGAFVADAAHVLTQRMRGLVGIREKLYDMGASWLMAEELGMDVRYASGGPLLIEELILDKAIDRPWVMFPKENEYFLTEDRGER